jgi:hypothetical protein
MKKSMFLIACFSIFFTHAMEQPDRFSITLYGTTIDVSTKFLSNIVNIDLFVAGHNDQGLLSGSTAFGEEYMPGMIFYRNDIYWENKDHESYYRDDTWEFFGKENRLNTFKQTQKNIISQPTRNIVMVITEPCISLKGHYYDPITTILTPVPQYKVIRFDTNDQQLLELIFEGDQAITEASKDVTLCYKKILEQGSYITNKFITIPTLSADVGFPRDKAAPIALTAITHFLAHNQGAYQRIKLLIKKRSEFIAYKTFLMNYWKKPSLLYCAHKDENHFLYAIPREIIDCILLLMHLEQD